MALARLAQPDIEAICEAVIDSFRVGLRDSRGGNSGPARNLTGSTWVRETASDGTCWPHSSTGTGA